MILQKFLFILIIVTTTLFYSCSGGTSSNESDNKSLENKNKEKSEQKAELIDSPNDTLNGSVGNISTSSSFGDLSFLNEFKGKYPHDVKLLDHPIIKKRLMKLIKKQYDYLKEIWEVDTPIEIENGLFYARAMQAHSGGDPGAVIMADLKKNILYVGIRKNQNVRVYSEDRSKAPKRMLDWSME